MGPVLAFVALIWITTSVLVTPPDRQRWTGRPKDRR